MRIDSSGNVGIGTSSPENKLDVRGIVNCTNASSEGSGTEVIRFARSDFPDFYHSIFASAGSGSNADHKLDFRLNTGSSDTVTSRMTLVGNGNVGIGTTSPAQKLHLLRASSGATYGADGADLFIIENNDTIRIDLRTTSSNTAGIMFSDNVRVAGELSYSHSSDSMSFRTNSAGRMTIDSNGNVLIGRTDNPSGVSNSLYATGVYAVTGAVSANVHVNSEGLLYRATSSLRYKNTIQNATHGLTELLNLRPVTFKSNNEGDKIFGGLIAEEVHEAGLTEFVEYDDEGNPDALHYSNMVSICIKAIQEQQTKIQELEARITALETQP
jgi:hypothetical protein